MGNEGSKPKGTSNFTRSDTATSIKSGRSIRSRKSNKESQSENSSHKTSTTPNMSRRSSFKSVKDLANDIHKMSVNDDVENYDYINDKDNEVPNNHEPLPGGINTNYSGYQRNNGNTPDIKLPPSMANVRPKSPILRMNSTSSINEDNKIQHSVTQDHHVSDSQSIHSANISRRNSTAALNSPKTPLNIEIPSNAPFLEPNSFKSQSSSISSRIKTPSLDNFPKSSIEISNENRIKYDLNIEDLIQRLLDAGYSGKRTKSVCLKNNEIAMICSTAREVFLSQPPLLELSAPVKIVGDVHGQYSDLIRIFSKCGFPPTANYLFLGDYVDRGKQSLETILLLLCYKIKYPENFFLLRGNHECAQITRAYGFYDECKRRTNLKTWKIFIDTFNTLPISAIVASKIFCVHGGLSPVLNSMDEIRNIRRPTDVPDFGLLNDLLWSDPADTPNEWEDNERGVSYCFNKVAINKFLNKFQFDLVVRAHMVVEDGYEFFNDRSLVTVFSAPNYCGEFDNWGAVMSVSEELLCSFELLDPLDSVALKNIMKKGRIERRNAMLNYTSSPSNQSY